MIRTTPRDIWGVLLLGSLLSLPAGAGEKARLSVADFARPDSPTCGIQEAIDALPAEGGVVTIPPGAYRLRRSVALRNHVTLRGAGSTTILTRGKQAAARLTRDARKDEPGIEIDSTEGFQPGDEIGLMSDPMHGWYMAHCVVKEVQPKRLVFTEPIHSGHPVAHFRVEEHAVAVNYFAFIRGSQMHFGEPVVDVAILDLCIDGNVKENPGPWTDFTLAAIHLANVSDALVRGVTIRGSVGDGIGVQGGRDNRVESCLVEHCRVHGLHPGTSLAGAVFTNNVSRHNGGDGLYFCAEVTGIVVTGNLLHDNAANGIGGLGEADDRFNAVTNNICRRNGLWGIHAHHGSDNVIAGNVCLDNSQKQPCTCGGIGLADCARTLVSANRCGSEGDKPTQRFGIEETGTSDTNVFIGNLCAGNRDGGLSVVGPNSQVSGNVGTVVRAKGGK